MALLDLFRASPQKRMTGATGLALVALVWLGMVLGVSFLATTAKFMAPTLSLDTALDVGRHTFRVFIHVELVFYGAMLLLVAGCVRGWLTWIMAMALGGIVAFEFIWLLPTLDNRVGVILAGGAPVASDLHEVYIVLEVIKATLLCITGVWAIFALFADEPERSAAGDSAPASHPNSKE